MVEEDDIEVFSSKMGVTVGGLDFEDSLLHLEDGDIEGSTTEIVYGDDRVVGAVQPVGEGGGGGLVDDAEDIEACDRSGVFCCLALGVVEVGGHGDDGVLDTLVQVLFGRLAHFGENH